MTDEDRDLIDEIEAAELLGVGRSTLIRWRRKGQAPPYIQYESGAVRYERAAVVEWREKHVVAPDETDASRRAGGSRE
jgi:predicted DNA-binding transcriptional regulator AlpA